MGRTQDARPTPLADLLAPDVSVCIVNWNCRELLRKCLASLYARPQGVSFEVVEGPKGLQAKNVVKIS